MSRLARIACAAVLAVAVGSLPLVADWCASVCESAVAVTTAAPACHHMDSTTTRIGERQAPCSHDRHAAIVNASTTSAETSQSLATGPALSIVEFAISTASITFAGSSFHRIAAASSPLPLTLASTLRI